MSAPTPTYEDRRPAAMGGMYRSKRGVSQAAGNRSYLDELYFRNAGLSSSEARQAAIDLMRSGFNVLPSGEATPSDLFARSSRMQRTSTPAAGQPPSAVPDDTVTPSEQGALASITGLNPDDLRAMASVQPTMRERFSTVATEEPTAQLGETVITGSRPAQGMPPTIRDVLSDRVDTIGPAGAPTRISSNYGTATLGTPGARATVNEGAATRFNSVPLQKYLKQLRVDQRERGIPTGGSNVPPQASTKGEDMQLNEPAGAGYRPSQGLPPSARPLQASAPTIRDVLSERVDTIGPAGTPTRISSKYGTATLGTPGARGMVNEGAMTRFNSIPLQKYLRQRRAAQRERGIA